MSRNSKNARNLAKARDISKMHANGEKGPARTSPQHGKKWGYRDSPEVAKRIAEMVKATQEAEKTSGKKILRGAGKASAPLQVAR
jgi:hypothetical protein